MSDKLLFQSGSASLDKRGEEALGKLAEVLNKQTDIDVFIEGHTDNKPINTVQFKDCLLYTSQCQEQTHQDYCGSCAKEGLLRPKNIHVLQC